MLFSQCYTPLNVNFVQSLCFIRQFHERISRLCLQITCKQNDRFRDELLNVKYRYIYRSFISVIERYLLINTFLVVTAYIVMIYERYLTRSNTVFNVITA